MIHPSKDSVVVTQNTMGYMLKNPDQLIQDCVAFAAQHENATIVDIGAAYGVATLALLRNTTAKVISNDISSEHLDTLLENTPKEFRARLLLQKGRFPDEATYAPESIDAFLASRVFHFFTGSEIIASLDLIYKSLRPNGKVFITVMSPYTGFLKKFMPIYEANQKTGMTWPGEMQDHYQYCPKNIERNAPSFFHVMTPDILSKALHQQGFTVEKAEFYCRQDCPEYIKYDGRESCILIGKK